MLDHGRELTMTNNWNQTCRFASIPWNPERHTEEEWMVLNTYPLALPDESDIDNMSVPLPLPADESDKKCVSEYTVYEWCLMFGEKSQ